MTPERSGEKRCCKASNLRLFIAVELGSAVRRQVEEIQALLRSATTDVSWVRPENFHLTLKFLGSTPSEQVDPIEQALSRAVTRVRPFEVELRGVGAFPSPSRARVVWVGLVPERPLVQLAGNLEDELARLGFAREARAFTAHVTLGRRRNPRRDDTLQKKLAELAGAGGARAGVSEAVLMQSQLRPGGPIYAPVSKHLLQG